MIFKKLLILPLVIIAFSPAFGDSWVKEFVKDGITIYTMDISDSAIKAFRSESEIDAPIELISAIVNDTKLQVKWMPDCIVSEIIKKNDSGYEISYNETKVPIVSNRDVVVESRIENTKNKITYIFHAIDRPDLKPEIKGKVRIKDMDGKWELTRKGQKTYVVYEVRADPGGNIPAWLVNRMSKDMPYETMLGLKKMAAGENTFP
jgi:hypothetical protein